MYDNTSAWDIYETYNKQSYITQGYKEVTLYFLCCNKLRTSFEWFYLLNSKTIEKKHFRHLVFTAY